jgi:putative transcriptional regulator
MSMGEHHYLTNQLLIAMPSLADPNFSQTVTLVCEHSDQGALGVILNRPLDMRLGEIFDQLSLPNRNPELAGQMVLRGGPVQPDRGFVLHRPTGREWDSTLEVSDGLHVTTSRDILESMARGEGPAEAAMALGYAGWDAGQLEDELLQNSWLTAPCDDSIVFDVPFEQRWHAAARLLGVDLARISHVSGRA